ncbi:MAG: 5'/3'-nucleotidase SurE [Thermodesulfobacteriota bacterium]|nr:5'/3'-nucleotidase SurE [Thermodesulfobacteriota bacterium]MEE2975149.1 5'/3'-nucleotidase SurE [Thermodesulfobacteriota bacterium]
MRILLTNDDGIHSEGIYILQDILSKFGETIVVAPSNNQSTKSHAISLSVPLRVREFDKNKYSVLGLPADCVNYAINSKLGKKKFDLVVSGINNGANMGDDINYSGTVAAAREGFLHGINSIALSIANKKNPKYKDCAISFETILSKILKKRLKSFFFNINYPNINYNKIKGVKITKQGARAYGQKIVSKKDPRNNEYFWIGGNDLSYMAKKGTDIHAVRSGFVSITPLITDYTKYSDLNLKL